MPKLERSQWCDLSRDMHWRFKYVQEVFTPFFTTKASGMGMGLPISRTLIAGHGGGLWAAPNSPHGAVFSFTLPVAAGSAP